MSFEKKYLIKLKGTNCYLKNTTCDAVNFTTDSKKAKVFVENFKKPDLIAKLLSGEYKVRKETHKCDFIKLTLLEMFQETGMIKIEVRESEFYKIEFISETRQNRHQYSFSLLEQFGTKSKVWNTHGEYPNFNCQYYGEDFEREYIK